MNSVTKIFCLSVFALSAVPAFGQHKGGAVEIDYNNPRTYIVGGIKVEGNRAFGDKQILQQSGLRIRNGSYHPW